jgi:hypothetical protein
MRHVNTAVLCAAALVIATVGLPAQTHPSFAGKWVLDASSAPQGGGGGRGGGRGGALGQELTITQDASMLTLEYVGGGRNPAPVKLSYKLDGTESTNMVMARGGEQEQVAKAVWEGSTLVITTTTGFGEQKRVFSLEDGSLAVETTQPGRDGGPGMAAKVTYTKAM